MTISSRALWYSLRMSTASVMGMLVNNEVMSYLASKSVLSITMKASLLRKCLKFLMYESVLSVESCSCLARCCANECATEL